MASLIVTPKSSLADSPVWIRASGLDPSQLVTLHVLLTDDMGEKFQSRAYFQANLSGEVDVKQAAAQGGDYVGVWPMGLFSSLKPDKKFRRLMKRNVTGSPFRVQVNLFGSVVVIPSPNEVPLATCTVERWYAAHGVQRVQVKEGKVRGALFLPPGPGPFPGVIDLFGGSGGLIEFRAVLLANKGFAVLALAFFGYDDLPQSLEEVDLEYFEEASILLLKHPKVRGPGLGVVGLSKGSEIALAMITFLDQIVAAVCINGATGMRDASLRFRDVYIPAIPYAGEKVLITEIGAISSYYVMEGPLDERHHASAIPLEKAQGPVLFVVSESDQSLNSKLFAEVAIARAKQHGKRNCALLSYPGAGHLLEPPGSPLCYCSAFRSTLLPNQWGGEVELHAKAQEHSWKEIQKFLELHLGPVGKSNF